MLNTNVIQRKIKLMYDDLAKLEPLEKLTFDEISKDYYKFHAAERLLERIIARAVDINRHTISEIGIGSEKVNDHYDSFIVMGQLGVISEQLAKEIAPSTSLRNRLVHDYNDTDDKIIHSSISKAIDQYAQYCDVILKFTASHHPSIT